MFIDSKLYTINEVCEILSIHRNSIKVLNVPRIKITPRAIRYSGLDLNQSLKNRMDFKDLKNTDADEDAA